MDNRLPDQPRSVSLFCVTIQRLVRRKGAQMSILLCMGDTPQPALTLKVLRISDSLNIHPLRKPFEDHRFSWKCSQTCFLQPFCRYHSLPLKPIRMSLPFSLSEDMAIVRPRSKEIFNWPLLEKTKCLILEVISVGGIWTLPVRISLKMSTPITFIIKFMPPPRTSALLTI